MTRGTWTALGACLLGLLVPLTTIRADERSAQLDQAETLLRGPYESQVHQGAKICLDLNDVKGVELLLATLDAEQPHYRDIVWEYLPRFTDAYARERVAKELRTNRKNARARQWTAQALGLFGTTEHAGTLEKALAAKEDFVQAAALHALGQLKHAPAFDDALRHARDKSGIVREAAVTALCRIDPERGASTFEAAVADADGGVRCALLGRAPELYPDRVERLSVDALADTDWRPRRQAVENLRTLRTLTAVDALVRAAGDVRPVVAHDAMDALATLSGKQFTLPEQWHLWWSEARATFAFPAPPDPAGPDAPGPGAPDGAPDPQPEPPPAPSGSKTVAQYNGLPVVSDHVAFVVDKSQTMLGPAESGGTKDQRAATELDGTLATLAGQPFVFNVYTYGDEQRRWSKKSQQLDAKSRPAVAEFLGGIGPKGRKAIWEILETVVSDPDVDTVYLLSSGEPEIGLYVHWNRVTEHLAELNRFHKVTVHTVVWNEKKWFRDQLQKIAECTGGRFIAEK